MLWLLPQLRLHYAVDCLLEARQHDSGPKTYKREVALVMLGYLGLFFIWGVSNATALRIAEFLTLPVFGFVTAAFGLDALAKQFRNTVA